MTDALLRLQHMVVSAVPIPIVTIVAVDMVRGAGGEQNSGLDHADNLGMRPKNKTGPNGRQRETQNQPK
jgi:hypothetical protein